MANPLPLEAEVGVIGAGAMGAGIAQIAAQAGHRVHLFDTRMGATDQATTKIGEALVGLAAKGKLARADADAAIARIVPVHALGDLVSAKLVIEAIAEDLDVKRKLLRELEVVVVPEAILASNTSSLSITALAAGLKHPGRVVGMHFFNPAPVLPLVEVVSGLATRSETAAVVYETAKAWGKVPVHAASTPGFIVNRCARPFYAEALRLLAERAADPATLDAVMREAGGFRMGAFELMDMIGHDVNYAVTQSVFDANYGDRRYAPSLVQRALIDGGRLGRKVGKGFYDGVPVPEADAPSATEPAGPLTLHGEGPLATLLEAWLAARGIGFSRVPVSAWTGIKTPAIELRITDGRTAIHVAAETHQGELAVIDIPAGVPSPGKAPGLAIAFASSASPAARDNAVATLRACGWQPRELRDVPGLWAARTLAMLVNEGADAVSQGVCDEAGADTAMKLGTNWPAGPFEWLQRFGIEALVAVLDHLHATTRNERYRVSPLLQQRLWAQRFVTRR